MLTLLVAEVVAPGLLDALLTPGGIAAGIGVVLGVLGALLASKAVWRRRVALAAYHAFHVVEDLDAEMGTEKLDKVVAGLKAADDYMLAHGWRPLKPGEQTVAKLEFKAMNGAAEAAAVVQAKALVLATNTPAKPSP